jgi:anti-sigma factor RsiW
VRLKVAVGAAVAVLIAAGAVAIWRPDPGVSERSILSLFTAEHQRLVAGGGISSGDAAEVTRWFAGRVDFALRIPEFAGAALRGGRLCMADGHRGAIVEYEFEGQMVSYFVLPLAVRGAPAELRHAAQAGYRVVWWMQDGLLHGVVGGLPAERLEQLAKWCRELLGKPSGSPLTGRPQSAVLQPWEG